MTDDKLGIWPDTKDGKYQTPARRMNDDELDLDVHIRLRDHELDALRDGKHVITRSWGMKDVVVEWLPDDPADPWYRCQACGREVIGESGERPECPECDVPMARVDA